jgi:transposase
MSVSDTPSLFLPLPDDIFISLVRPTTTEFVIHIACKKPYALCPCCGACSERVHGHYVRTVADLPCSGRRVILALTVRKFVCTRCSCPQKIFTERLTELLQSYARMTNRLRDALVALGLATSAQVSERLAPSLGMKVSAPTLLRRLREIVCPPPKSVRILGVDDWAWKKGQTYATLLVDLELRKPIELLPDRKEATLTAWLLLHPEIRVISRDRGGEYAAAARKGAPQAQQIADKFHILKNLRDGRKELMARKQKVLPEVEEASSDSVPLRAQGKLQGSAEAEGAQPDDPEKRWRSMSKEPRHSSPDPTCKPCIKGRLSPARASWLYISQVDKLDEKQKQQIELMRVGHPDLDRAYQLAQMFVCMLAEHRDTDLDGWLAQAEHSGIRELKSFAHGIQRDYDAVRASFTSPWSNGPLEAQVNCLKLQCKKGRCSGGPILTYCASTSCVVPNCSLPPSP